MTFLYPLLVGLGVIAAILCGLGGVACLFVGVIVGAAAGRWPFVHGIPSEVFRDDQAVADARAAMLARVRR